MDNTKFKYFLNAIHYCIWLYNRKLGDITRKVVNTLLSPVLSYLFTKEYRNKYYDNMPKELKKKEEFFNDKETGFHIGWAHHWFGYFYSGYSAFLSFIIIGIADKQLRGLSAFTFFILFGIPILLCYIPAYRAIFTKDCYLKYFKEFEKKNNLWHKKWKWITVSFCVGSIVATLMGVVAMSIVGH